MPKYEDWLAWKLAEERGDDSFPPIDEPIILIQNDETNPSDILPCQCDHPIERLRH